MNFTEKYLRMALEVASWSKDPSTKVGCVLVSENNTVISVGYNGFPRGFNDSKELLENRETRLDYTIHAERNAIYNAARTGVNVFNSVCYTTHAPCRECTLALVQSGIKRIVTMRNPVFDERWKEDIEKATLVRRKGNKDWPDQIQLFYYTKDGYSL